MDTLAQLFIKFTNNECNAEELEYLLKHFAEGKDEEGLKNSIKAELNRQYEADAQLDLMVEEVFVNIKEKIDHQELSQPVPLKPRSNTYRYAVAAVVLLAIGASLWMYLASPKSNGLPAGQPTAQLAISPGSNKAFLTLNNGTKINLTSADNGTLAKEAGFQIVKTADGQLIYEIKTQDQPNGSSLFNTIETPKGGQYQIHLPDGTKVWLNAATKLKYPLNFIGAKERRVELDGEAYFEVAKDKAHPFRVMSSGQQVEVMGTHFNVNAYANENTTKTTLLEGAVRVSALSNGKNKGNEFLKPGQQAVLGANRLNVIAVDAEAETAWKNGRFTFVDEPIESIMRKVARWYDVEIVYKGNMHEKVFAGTVSRYDNIEKLLNTIASTNTVHFKIEGRRVIVMD